MSDIDAIQLRRLDMTQLLVFAGIMQHRKLTVVAEHLGLTQSAISHSLKRLRETFNDELFLRRPSGVEPTARAIALESRVLKILKLTEEALDFQNSFDPMREDRIIRINAPDYELAVFTSRMIETLSTEAPLMRLSFRSMPRPEALQQLVDGTLDLSIGFTPSPGDQFEQLKLYDEHYRVVARKDHPLLETFLTLETYCQAEHLLVSPKGDLVGIVDQTLKTLGFERRVVASVPLFFPAMATVAQSSLFATIPARLADSYAPQFGLVSIVPPLAIRPFQVSLTWHRRNSSDLALAWLRERIAGLV